MGKFERTAKQSHRDTTYYEIDMLRFAGRHLVNRGDYDTPDLNLLIEGFLLHYRNLLEFFSGNKHRPADASKPKATPDLSTRNPRAWGDRELTDEEQKVIVEAARAIFDPDWLDISQYLQHCTERRFKTARDWKIPQMLESLERIIVPFEISFPRERPQFVVGPENNSTATFSYGTTSNFEQVLTDGVNISSQEIKR